MLQNIRYLYFTIMLLVTAPLFPQTTEYMLSDSLQTLLKSNNKPDLKRCETLETIIEDLHGQKLYLPSAIYVDELKELSKKLNSSYFLTLSEYYQGFIANEESNRQSLHHFLTAKEMAAKLPNNIISNTLKVRIQIAIGSKYISMVMLPQAYTNLQEGIEFNKAVGDTRLQFNIENYLLVVYRFLHLNREIIAVCKSSLSKPEYSAYNKYFLYYNIAACYTDLRNYDSAEMYLDTAIIYAQTVRDSALIPYYRGAINIEKHQYNESLENFDESMKEIKGKDHEDVEANILVYKGLSLLRLDAYDSAMTSVDRGISIAERNDYLYVLERGLEIKQEILYETKNYEKYTEVSRQHKTIKDSLDIAENVERLQQLELERQFTMAKEQMAQAQLVKDMKHQRQRLILYLIIVILAFGITIIFLVLNRNKMLLRNKQIQEEAMSRELDLRNRELTAKALVQTQRQEILTDIIDKLVAIQGDKKKLSENIQAVIKDFKQYRNAQTPEDFEYYFTQTHPDFYKNLQNDFPELTPHEMHLCAYIRLNLNTKDIAQISGIEPASVRMARHRLRKTLGIANSDTDLTKFLSKY